MMDYGWSPPAGEANLQLISQWGAPPVVSTSLWVW